MSISSTLISWYLPKKRNLPWRNTRNPYYIWVSEVVLQQTRVAQGIDYYYRFIEHFPNINSLANAHPDEVMKVWQGLGYYSRARNLQAGAKVVQEKFRGQLPANFELLLSIKGVGPYTAAAIASFAFDLPFAVVDGNVSRVLARLFGIFEPVNSSRGAKMISQKAEDIFNPQQSALHNQAIMELGALQCVPRNPDCTSCPFHLVCFAWQHQQVDNLPQKKPKGKVRPRYHNYMVVKKDGGVFLTKRAGKDIWHGLYEFPLIETESPMDDQTIQNTQQWNEWFGNACKIESLSDEFIHQLSHQSIRARFFMLTVDSKAFKLDSSVFLCPIANLRSYPVHKLIEKYLNNEFK
jgi:A/G-specific adenine glycosylase